MKPTLLNLLLLMGASVSAAAQFPTTARLSMDSFGPIHIGMTLERARHLTGTGATEQFFQKDCGFLMLHREGVQFMIQNGKVSRIDVIDARHPTLSGLRVGDSERRAHQVYEQHRLEVKRHAYDDNGHYLVLRSEDKKRALLLETDGKLIRKMRAGLVSAVELVEGCS